MRRMAANELTAQLEAQGVSTILTFNGPYGYVVQVRGSGETAASKSDATRLLKKYRPPQPRARGSASERRARSATPRARKTATANPSA